MEDNNFWDSDEYDFFDSLRDSEKLLYLYELMIGGYDYDNITDDDIDNFIDESLDDDNQNHFSKNKIIINGMDSLVLSGEELGMIQDVADMIMMNGVLLHSYDSNYMLDGSVTLSYKIIGKSHPICLN
jgi:hypothetical protein